MLAPLLNRHGKQATGLKEINIAVNTMDQGTQQNAAMVEETSAAAHSLAREAERLFELIASSILARRSRPAQRSSNRSGHCSSGVSPRPRPATNALRQPST